MASNSSACVTVATGGVGESGSSSLLIHTVSGPTSKMIVLRNAGSSLCPNTGAVAILTVNGLPVAFGSITAPGGSIQYEASPGSQIAAVIHTIPLFNGILCVRLGELTAKLQECDLVDLAPTTDRQGSVLTLDQIATRGWYAWNNLMPPKPDDFHIVGEVEVPNPGVEVLLVPKSPQGINPRILLLDLFLIQKPGIWPQIVVWKQARYDKVNVTYDSVQVFYGSTVIADVPVDTVV